MPASDSADRTPRLRSGFARLLAVLAVALTLVAIPAAMPDAAFATQKGRMSEQTAIKRCTAAGGTISWEFHEDGVNADMYCTLPSKGLMICVPVIGPFSNIVDCF